MIKFKNILTEGKSIGDVYHFTNLNGMLGILDTNTLRPSAAADSKSKIDYVSTTRDKNFVNTRSVAYISGELFRITLDGNKISSRYKSKPHDDRYSYKTKQYTDSNLEYGDEMEERFLCGPKGIVDIKRYIKEVSMPKNKFMPFDFKFFYRNVYKGVDRDVIERVIGMDFEELNIGTNPIELVNNIKTYFKTRLNINIELK